MIRVRRAACALLATVAAGVLAGCGSSGPYQASAGYVSGDGTVTTWDAGERGAPVELAGDDFAGERHSVASWRGDVVVLNFWYAACPPCRAEAPVLVAAANDREADGVHFLGVNSTDDAATAAAFERSFSIPYPSIDDADASATAALAGYVSLQAVPTTIVLDRDGAVAARVLGQVDASTLDTLIDDAAGVLEQ